MFLEGNLADITEQKEDILNHNLKYNWCLYFQIYRCHLNIVRYDIILVLKT
jgi:hypothetical protein